jgi:TonB family protein
MRRFVVIFSFVFSTLHLCGFSQTVVKIDSVVYEKAKYLKGDLARFLCQNAKYPIYKSVNSYDNSQGDVIYSFVINKNGKLENLQLESSTQYTLDESAKEALKKLDEKWSPTKINHIPVDKKYKIIFRFRSYLDAQPPEYKEKIESLVKRHKYDKAIKLYDEQIFYNSCDFELFAERSKLKEKSGDKIGAIEDYKWSDRLSDEYMTVVNVIAVGITNDFVKPTISTSAGSTFWTKQ